MIVGSTTLAERFSNNRRHAEILASTTISCAEKIVSSNTPDVIVTELHVPTAQQFEFIDKLEFLDKKPILVVVGDLQDDNYYARAKRLGAKFTYRAPYDIDTLIEDVENELFNIRYIESSSQKTVSDKAIDERLAHILISAGIPPHIRGYQFLREAVKFTTRTPSLINNITKKLYPAVADKFETTPSKVERAIRHAIEVAWERGKIENINSIYGIKIFAKGEKPTNGELIALVSDKIIIDCG
jgi:two-component system response regulator (stage 0 sporulation protein A)